ncbi:hypothetical protein BD410DRAFT_795956 [Rickenella mellea]|uniref:F-box domain-containing protein n=1 Tax=Rickenella mellea TaxID=50990 RepID=A0A4Y7PM28_9AGAM|nr:hypothetical protein BD410DRAFT_795956 [Rickenella mellea]
MEPHFPPEIWSNIFRFATFTATSLNEMDWNPHWPYASSPESTDPTLSYRSTLRTKKTLTLVSRTFRGMSLEYLFEIVKLLRPRKAQLLLHTILSRTTGPVAGNSPAKFIKYIIINLDPGSASDSRLMDGVLTKIFPFCTNLAGFGWTSTERVLRGGQTDNSTLIASIPLTITTLEWNRDTLRRPFHALRNHITVRNLRVSHLLPAHQEDFNVKFPFITHLYARTPFAGMAISRWSLPSLTHLNLEIFSKNHLELLFGKCKESIRSIYIAAPWRTNGDLSWILASIPKLETFSYDISIDTLGHKFSSPWLDVGHHASLTHISIFCRPATDYGKATISNIRDFFSLHLQPLTSGHVSLLTISIVDARNFFEQGFFSGSRI